MRRGEEVGVETAAKVLVIGGVLNLALAFVLGFVLVLSGTVFRGL